MLLHIITPTPAYIFRMMQLYNNFIFALDRKMCLHIHFYSKLCLQLHFIFLHYFLNITPIDLRILIFYCYKVLSCSFVYVFKMKL